MRKIVSAVKLGVILFTPFLVTSDCFEFFCAFQPGSIICVDGPNDSN